jgi:thymidylate kinase
MSATEPHLIAVEGLDGSGKSTFARVLAAALGADFMRTPHDLDADTRTAMEAHCARSTLARMLFYSATVAAAAVDIQAALTAGRSVVVDRYWLSTVAYHRVMGAPCVLDEVAGILPRAHCTVYLHAPLAVRALRVQARGLTTAADRWSLQPDPSRRIEDQYRSLARHRIVGRFLELDAGEKTPEALVADSVSRLREA